MDYLRYFIGTTRPPVLYYNRIETNTNMFTFFNCELFDFELTRLLGSTATGGCDIAEFLSAVAKIRKHDAESWLRAWNEQGERAERIGDEAAKAGFRVLARKAYLRSSNYFRAAPYMLPNDDARIQPFTERSIKIFQEATTLMDGEVVIVEIPYEKGLSLPGYLYLPPRDLRLPGKTPVVMNLGGADSTKEELFFLFGATGPQLGYAVLCFEGPGQGLLLKKSKLPLRPDFEVVTGIALGFLSTLAGSRPELQLDLERIAVAGGSTGGFFALRAATDPRIKACISIDPFFSLWDLAMTRVPLWYVKLWDSGWIPDGVFDWSTDMHCSVNFPTRWEMGLGKWSMGVGKSTAMLRRFRDFSLETERDGKILDRVACPVFLTGPGAGKELYASANDSTFKIHRLLTKVSESDKEVWVPTDVAEGGLTAKVGAWALLAQKSFEFLDKHFEIKRKAL